jgi:hypothetical protein
LFVLTTQQQQQPQQPESEHSEEGAKDQQEHDKAEDEVQDQVIIPFCCYYLFKFLKVIREVLRKDTFILFFSGDESSR